MALDIPSWGRFFTLTVPLSTQMYKWVLVNGGNPAMDYWYVIHGGGG